MSRARSPGWPTLLWSALVWSGLGAATALADASPPPTPSVIASIDLFYPFDTRSAWSFTANQGPPIADPFGSSGDQLPGTVSLCLRKGASGPCDTQLQGSLPDTSDDTLFSERHYLDRAEIVRPHGKSGRPILLLVTASLHSGDGDQLVLTQALAYQIGPALRSRVRAFDRDEQQPGGALHERRASGRRHHLGRSGRDRTLRLLGLRQHSHLSPRLPAGAEIPQCHGLRRWQPVGGDRLGDGEHPTAPWPMAAWIAAAASRHTLPEAALEQDGALVRVKGLTNRPS